MNRHVVANGSVVASGTIGEITRGRMYAQALIRELDSDASIETWVAQAAVSDEQLEAAVTRLFGQLHSKVRNGEQWTNLPASAVGGSVRDIAQNVPKIISMALKADIDSVRGSVLLPVGYFTRLCKQSHGSRVECPSSNSTPDGRSLCPLQICS